MSTEGTIPLLRDLLIETTFAPNRSLRAEVTEVNLGVFHPEAEALISFSLADPTKREAGKIIYITNDRRVLVPVKPTIGNTDNIHFQPEVHLDLYSPSAEKNQRQQRHIGLYMHCHGVVDLPPSPYDNAHLFLSDLDPHAITAGLITTASLHYLLFRGENTPQWSRWETWNTSSRWVQALVDRLRRFVPKDMPFDETVKTNFLAQNTMLRQICEKYDLQIFSGPRNNPILGRHIFPRPVSG